jgi:FKBP-type peptidyl-prolyl cis-trans isomerase 2
MTTIKKNDFVEVEYTGKLKEDNFVFDTTSEKTAKENGIHNPRSHYGPTVVCIGQGQLLKGLDEKMEGKEIGKEYDFVLTPEEGFGKKSAQLLKLIPLNAFKKGDFFPEVGMQVDIDGQMGIVKTVSGGRVIVDFNHPLSSKELEYKIKANKLIIDDVEKVKTMISLTLNLKKEHIDVKIETGKATVTMLKLPEMFQKEFEKKIKEVVPTIKEVAFQEEKKEKQSLNTSK